MHIHGNSMSINAIDFYSAAQGAKAAAAERAAEVRKKLLKGSSQIEGAATPEETLMNGHWLDSWHSQVQSEEQYHASAVGKDPDFG
jgi:hypothetical protein